jgi:hypothetical protein
MSSSIYPLNVETVLDNRLKTGQSRDYAVVKGASAQTWKSFNSTSVSNSNVAYIANPPSNRSYVNDCIYQQWNVTFTFNSISNSTAAGQYLLDLAGGDGLRAYPIASSCDNYTLNLNNFPLTLNIKRYWAALQRYHQEKCQLDENSFSTTYPDQYFNYADGYGANNNPLGQYYDNPYESLRGAFKYVSVTNPLSTGSGQSLTATVNCIVTEPLFLSPFSFGRDRAGGMIQIANLQCNAVITNLNRMWSRIQGAIPSVPGPAKIPATLSVTINSANLLVNFLNGPVNMEIPKMQILPYYKPDEQITNLPTVNGGATFSQDINSLQFASIPKKIYVFVKRQIADETELTTDTFAVITKISINFNNNPNILSDATVPDLFAICHQNGLKMNYQQFASTIDYNESPALALGCGSVVCLEFAKDIPLNDPVLAPGVGAGNTYNFQMTVSGFNPTAQNITYNIYTVPIYEGICVIKENECLIQTGILTYNDVLNAKVSTLTYFNSGSIYGGNFFSNAFNYIKDAVKSVIDFGRKAAPVANALIGEYGANNPTVKKIVEQANKVNRLSKKLGYGLLDRNDLRDMD